MSRCKMPMRCRACSAHLSWRAMLRATCTSATGKAVARQLPAYSNARKGKRHAPSLCFEKSRKEAFLWDWNLVLEERQDVCLKLQISWGCWCVGLEELQRAQSATPALTKENTAMAALAQSERALFVRVSWPPIIGHPHELILTNLLWHLARFVARLHLAIFLLGLLWRRCLLLISKVDAASSPLQQEFLSACFVVLILFLCWQILPYPTKPAHLQSEVTSPFVAVLQSSKNKAKARLALGMRPAATALARAVLCFCFFLAALMAGLCFPRTRNLGGAAWQWAISKAWDSLGKRMAAESYSSNQQKSICQALTRYLQIPFNSTYWPFNKHVHNKNPLEGSINCAEGCSIQETGLQ